jgi:F0F1-type ATP synthase assembly protein I
MEFIVRLKVRLRNAYLAASCMLGAASGLVVDVVFDDPPVFIIFGTIIGLLTGLVLYDKDMQSSLSIKFEVQQK